MLISAVVGAINSLLMLSLFPVVTTLALVAPPLYALVAAAFSILPYTMRRLWGAPFSATLVAFISGLLSSAFSSIGFLAMIPIALGAVIFDLVAPRATHPGAPGAEWRWLVASFASGASLFAISLTVFSADHMTPVVVIATAVARLGGQAAAILVAGSLARSLRRAGIVLDRL
ncbi:hypothetical protein IT072_03410 [Leifsonia sp. ZF2019]|uniref:hypothetical protein n=1 Tax=Leifsonia sp. ZF2019 TaxID=2781978 RepID=UPI001CBE3AB0|nr:hypothetical protein [Leifsonia sp. ZF2019]UAJ80111.1 hypothetical protein IT072_03410 [Leifsonia sp. ZF2019]